MLLRPIQQVRVKKGELMFFGQRSILLLISAALLCAAVAIAQTSEAELTGAVKDPSGAPVSGANVTATYQDTGVSRTITTDNAAIRK